MNSEGKYAETRRRTTAEPQSCGAVSGGRLRADALSQQVLADRMIRRAHPEDAAALTSCFKRAYAAYADRISDLPPVCDGIAEDISNYYVWVAERGGEIVGGLVLIVGPGQAKLANLGVVPSAAGQGLATALIEVAEDECRAWGVRDLELTTHAEMTATLRLYETLGWRRTGREGPKVFMKKRLTA